MSLLRLLSRIATCIVLAASLVACVHPLPHPGQVVISCAMDAVHDPKVINAFLQALGAPNWQAAVADVIAGLGPAGEEIAVCVISAYVNNPSTVPRAAPAALDHGRAFLASRGVQ